jgi:predicted anti-sigma-YlaC factor YlaD
LEGKSIPDSLQAVEHHLGNCGECQEEYEALLTALKAAE